MAIPSLDGFGYLPAGDHLCELHEVQQTFVHNERRKSLFESFRLFLQWLDAEGLSGLAYYMDGGFATGKAYPKDIDVILDLTDATPEQQKTALFHSFTNQDYLKAQFYVDFWVYFPGCARDLRAFFQYIRIEELNAAGLSNEVRKGILRIQP